MKLVLHVNIRIMALSIHEQGTNFRRFGHKNGVLELMCSAFSALERSVHLALILGYVSPSATPILSEIFWTHQKMARGLWGHVPCTKGHCEDVTEERDPRHFLVTGKLSTLCPLAQGHGLCHTLSCGCGCRGRSVHPVKTEGTREETSSLGGWQTLFERNSYNIFFKGLVAYNSFLPSRNWTLFSHSPVAWGAWQI